MSNAQQNTDHRGGYAETVKSAIVDSLEKGNSVLQKDRSGIDYSINASSGAVYSGVNQLFLQQQREEKGFKNPFFMTVQQAQDKGLFIKSGEKGQIISYYASTVRYHRDEYKRDEKGNVEKDANGKEIILHKKNEPKLNEKNQPYSGNEYNYVFNLQQINTEYRQYRQNATRDADGNAKPGFVIASKALVINENPQLENPFQAKKGAHYQKTDNTIMEKFAEDVSKYFNSIYTGAKFSGVSYTPDEIKQLKTEINNPRSSFFQKVNDASLVAAGQTEKLDRINENRQKKAERQSQGRSM
jgi:hypothetical protein